LEVVEQDRKRPRVRAACIHKVPHRLDEEPRCVEIINERLLDSCHLLQRRLMTGITLAAHCLILRVGVEDSQQFVSSDRSLR
jgi:hypothetical protein